MFESQFITYAQNGEDVLLWRALKHVDKGFYIDVGAQDPIEYSVTKAFYERGWRGINAEPVQHWHDRLVRDRPHDVNLRVAVSDRPGTLELYEVIDTGLSTSDPEFAKRHAANDHVLRPFEVPCVTLDQVCADNHVDIVHFLKVDCEGAEKQVLQGFSFSSVRPWIVLVEATEPNSTEPTWQQWEHLLTAHAYRFVFFDGLNRYYIADEHADLAKAFEAPVNVFDSARPIAAIEVEEEVRQLKRESEGLRDAAANGRLRAERDSTRAERDKMTAERDRVAAERDQMTAERDRVAAERDQMTADRNKTAAERDQMTAERDRVAAERDQMTADRNKTAAERDQMTAERNKTVAERDQMTAERDRVVAERDQMTAERNKTIAERDQMTAERDRVAAERDQMTAESHDLGARLLASEHGAATYRQEITRLQQREEALLSSRSWRLMAPMRGASLGARWAYRRLRRLLYLALRPLAHLLRPALRRLARIRAARRLATGVLGRRSRITELARLFLFGAASRGAAEATVGAGLSGRIGEHSMHRILNQSSREDVPGEHAAVGEVREPFDLDVAMERIRLETAHPASAGGDSTAGVNGASASFELGSVMQRVRAEVARRRAASAGE